MGEEIFIDANIFLEFILEDEKSEKCDILLKNIKTNADDNSRNNP